MIKKWWEKHGFLVTAPLAALGLIIGGVFVLSLIPAFRLNAGAPQPQVVPADPNAAFSVQFLFENDGVKVYRFYDAGWKYYAVAGSGVRTSWSESCGKNCVAQKELETVNRGSE